MLKEGRKLLAKKSLGQNFLFDREQLERIVSSSQIETDEQIIEIGPGLGTLTELINKSSASKIVCIEKDQRLHELLVKKFSNEKKLIFLLEDVLRVNWKELIKKVKCEKKPIVVGNLPYNISKEIIFNLASERNLFERFVFLVQKEVGKRIIANNKTYKQEYSFFSLFIDFFFETEFLGVFDKKHFKPIPKVDGALVALKVRGETKFFAKEKAKQEKFFWFLKKVFSFRRKTLWNNLKGCYLKEELVENAFKELNFEKKIRPQDLSAESYKELFEKLAFN